MLKQKNTTGGLEKLLTKMNDRAYAEVFDLPEDDILDPDYIPEDDEIDHNKDTDIKGR